MLEFERQAWSNGHERIAGIDEAGRGPLAGPVVAAAVVIERLFLESEVEGMLKGLDDSKKLSPAKREFFHQVLDGSSHVRIGVGSASAAEIDAVNILQATHLAMRRALMKLALAPDHALVDGLPVPGLSCPSTAIVHGDSLSLLIAAASVVAKVTRDRIMVEMDRAYPMYGFAAHKGYGTKAHVQALMEYGPCLEHRQSFQPVKDAESIRKRNLPGEDLKW